jgi:hypothetical protein
MVEMNSDKSAKVDAVEASRLIKSLGLGIRRCHLYLGLFLAPWALLYGFTGYLFNHPTHFSDRGLREISRGTLRECGYDGRLADPQIAAAEVIERLNARFPDVKLQLAARPEAKYVGDFFFAVANGSEKTYQLLIRRDGGGGTYLDSTVAPKPTGPTARFIVNPLIVNPLTVNPLTVNPLTVNPRAAAAGESVSIKSTAEIAPPEPLKIALGAAAQVEAILPELAQRLDLPGLDQSFRLTSAPQLQFNASSEGEMWIVKYDSFQGAVSAEWFDPASPVEPLSWRSYLLRLHTAHGYSGIYEARWFWAMIVDAMSFVMIFWAVSGIWMWWQIKRLRMIGLGMVAVSLVVAGLLFVGMSA